MVLDRWAFSGSWQSLRPVATQEDQWGSCFSESSCVCSRLSPMPGPEGVCHENGANIPQIKSVPFIIHSPVYILNGILGQGDVKVIMERSKCKEIVPWKSFKGAGEIAQVVDHMPNMVEPWVLFPAQMNPSTSGNSLKGPYLVLKKRTNLNHCIVKKWAFWNGPFSQLNPACFLYLQ